MSDSVSRGEKQDVSGKVLVERLKGLNFEVRGLKVVPDERDAIVNELKRLVEQDKVDLIVTTGGTGIGPRDVTPEATLAVIERRLDGIEEALRKFGQDRLPTAMLSRGVVGIRGKSLIINLPGSRGGVEDGMNAVFPAALHVFRMIAGEGHG
jgi:molybdenum cofactor synthesis domain-containing protein